MLIIRRSAISVLMFDLGFMGSDLSYVCSIYRVGWDEKESIHFVLFMIYDLMSYVFV